MIARPRAVTSTLPASLILAPRELKQYRRYQSQTTTLSPNNQGRLPTAVEYADFQSWLAKRDSGYLSDTPLADIAGYLERVSEKKEEKGRASVCGHALHPTHKDKAERCPVCTVDIHITYMKALTSALEAAGGLVKQRWEASDQECPALQAWYAGKLALVKELSRLENLASDEHDYDYVRNHQQTRSSNQATTEAKTATEALDVYWDSMEANPNIMQSPRKKRACTVVFCPETSFERGRDQLYFWRKSPRYEAGGKYASSDEEDEEEEVEDEPHEIGKEASSARGKISPVANTKEAIALGHNTTDEKEQSDEEASDLEDDDDDSDEEEDSDDEPEVEADDEPEVEADDEPEVEADADGSYIVFEYEEVVVQGAEFVVFEE